MGRIVALLILLIPGLIAGIGIKLMRDTIFGVLIPPFSVLWMQGLAGLLCFGFGLYIVAGFILYRDRKRNNVSARFKKNKHNNRDLV
jgi:hypothetical protein